MSGPGFGKGSWLLFRLLLPRTPLMLAMLGLVWSVCVVLPFLFLLLLLPIFGGSLTVVHAFGCFVWLSGC